MLLRGAWVISNPLPQHPVRLTCTRTPLDELEGFGSTGDGDECLKVARVLAALTLGRVCGGLQVLKALPPAERPSAVACRACMGGAGASYRVNSLAKGPCCLVAQPSRHC